MLAPEQIPVERARQAIAQRPVAGWQYIVDFWKAPALQGVILPFDVQLQPRLRTYWFAFDLRVELQGAELQETGLIDARLAPSRVVVRRWGSDD
jgi:general secretion pathway protein K